MSDNGFHERVGRNIPDARTYKLLSGADAGQGDPAAAKELPHSAAAVAQLGHSRWATRGDVHYGVGDVRDELLPGLYRCEVSEISGPVLVKQRIETDSLLELPDDAGASVLAEFASFWQIADKFAERGFLHKRGFLLWGPPGSGKTSTLQLMIKRVVGELAGVVLMLERPEAAAACLQLARKIEPRRPMIAIMEDIDALVMRHGEHEFLALLDGEAQVDKIVFLATTNYPERLDPRFVDRPSRFDTIRYIPMPSAPARRVYLKAKEPGLTEEELDRWVAVSDGFSVAHLKEFIIAVKCFGQPLEQVAERLAAMRERRPTSEDAPHRRGAGFFAGGVLRNGAGTH